MDNIFYLIQGLCFYGQIRRITNYFVKGAKTKSLVLKGFKVIAQINQPPCGIISFYYCTPEYGEKSLDPININKSYYLFIINSQGSVLIYINPKRRRHLNNYFNFHVCLFLLSVSRHTTNSCCHITKRHKQKLLGMCSE